MKKVITQAKLIELLDNFNHRINWNSELIAKLKAKGFKPTSETKLDLERDIAIASFIEYLLDWELENK